VSSSTRPRPAAAPPARTAPVPAAATTAEQVLAQCQGGREVVQDFVPLAQSLEWRLGQEYLRQRGNKAFLSDAHPVPFVVNNDGSLSHHAAEVFFASLLAAEKEGPLPAELFVLELGIGVGLFARFFLDAFRDLCARQHKDYYERLTYIAADRSQRMLLDVSRHGLFAHHPGRYRLRLVDALDPAPLLQDLMFRGQPARPLRAVFLNYLLDCLPAAVLQLDGDQVKQLCVRTCVARNLRLQHYTDLRRKGDIHLFGCRGRPRGLTSRGPACGAGRAGATTPAAPAAPPSRPPSPAPPAGRRGRRCAAPAPAPPRSAAG
jgi:hypothetical protein